MTSNNRTVARLLQLAAFGTLLCGATVAHAASFFLVSYLQSGGNIEEFSTTGVDMGPFAANMTGIQEPAGLALAKDGTILAADFSSGNIVRFANDGTNLGVVVNTGADSSPVGLAVDTAGNIYIASANISAGGEILEYTANGTSLGVFAHTGCISLGLAFDSGGNLYASDYYTGVKKFSPAGAGLPGPTIDTDNYQHPYGVAVDAANNLYVAYGIAPLPDAKLPRLIDPSAVVKFSANGTALLTTDVTSTPQGLAFDFNGNLLAAIGAGPFRTVAYSILQLTTGGTILGTFANTEGNNPAIILRVNTAPPTQAPQIISYTASPGNKVQAQSSVSFSVLATGDLPLSYVWMKDGKVLKNGGRVYNAMTSILTIKRLVFADAGHYKVTVSNSAGKVTSSAIVFTVKANRKIPKPSSGSSNTIAGRLVPH